jgi:hypothetical protein
LIFVEPDDRVRIVYVDLPSVLVGDRDPFGVNVPGPSRTAFATRRAPAAPARPLAVAPPIRGFGPDPQPVPRPRRTAPADLAATAVWDGSSPAPLGSGRMRVPSRGPGDDPGVLVGRASTDAGALRVFLGR